MPATINKPVKEKSQHTTYKPASWETYTYNPHSGKEKFPVINAVAVIAFLGVAIGLSLATDKLFLKELLIAGGIILMAMGCKIMDANGRSKKRSHDPQPFSNN